VRHDYAVFAFEEMDDDLSRPPLAAVRALNSVGVAPKLQGWLAMAPWLRRAFAIMGSQHTLDPQAIQTATRHIHPRDIILVGRRHEPDPDLVPDRVARALEPILPLTVEQWQRLHPFERFTLDALSNNTRLLWRALDEMARLRGHLLFGKTMGQAWVGPLARCELRTTPVALAALATKRLVDGRGVDLARATGRRAARRAPDLLDLVSSKAIGPVELECKVHALKGQVVWQAHVSSDEGEFLPDASLLAACSAAVALGGVLREVDPTVQIAEAELRDEPWQGDESNEDATEVWEAR
jgi:hypothetical protein